MAKAIFAADQPPSFLAGWTSRLALFCAMLLLTTVFLHRLLALPTPVALNIAQAAFAGAVLALAMGLIAGLDVWVTGRQGAPRIIFGLVVSLGLLAIPASIAWIAKQWPEINDVTTDVADPPAFVAVQEVRPAGANPIAYPAAQFADVQRRNYPDLKSLIVPRPPEETYEVVLQALAKLRYQIAQQNPPQADEGVAGHIEFTDTTLILGFADDIAIRVMEDEGGSSIDVRSASRFGHNDFGGNAERVRIILNEIVARLEATVPKPDETKAPVARRDQKKPVKRQKGRDPESAASRPRSGPSRSGIRRGPPR